MKIFANNSTVILAFGLILVASGVLDWVMDFIRRGPYDFPIALGFASVTLTGSFAMMVAVQLKKLEARLDEIERTRSRS